MANVLVFWPSYTDARGFSGATPLSTVSSFSKRRGCQDQYELVLNGWGGRQMCRLVPVCRRPTVRESVMLNRIDGEATLDSVNRLGSNVPRDACAPLRRPSRARVATASTFLEY